MTAPQADDNEAHVKGSFLTGIESYPNIMVSPSSSLKTLEVRSPAPHKSHLQRTKTSCLVARQTSHPPLYFPHTRGSWTYGRPRASHEPM